MKINELANNGARDFNGKRLCIPCWNNTHYVWRDQVTVHGKSKGGNKISNCAGDPCECDCRAMLTESHPRIKRDYSAQTDIIEQFGTIEVR